MSIPAAKGKRESQQILIILPNKNILALWGQNKFFLYLILKGIFFFVTHIQGPSSSTVGDIFRNCFA